MQTNLCQPRSKVPKVGGGVPTGGAVPLKGGPDGIMFASARVLAFNSAGNH